MNFVTDIREFAGEVKPTGAIPSELSLEHDRFAACPNKHQRCARERRFKPKGAVKILIFKNWYFDYFDFHSFTLWKIDLY